MGSAHDRRGSTGTAFSLRAHVGPALEDRAGIQEQLRRRAQRQRHGVPGDQRSEQAVADSGLDLNRHARA